MYTPHPNPCCPSLGESRSEIERDGARKSGPGWAILFQGNHVCFFFSFSTTLMPVTSDPNIMSLHTVLPLATSHLPSERDQIACFGSLISTGTRLNLLTCGTDQSNRKIRFEHNLRAGGQDTKCAILLEQNGVLKPQRINSINRCIETPGHEEGKAFPNTGIFILRRSLEVHPYTV